MTYALWSDQAYLGYCNGNCFPKREISFRRLSSHEHLRGIDALIISDGDGKLDPMVVDTLMFRNKYCKHFL